MLLRSQRQELRAEHRVLMGGLGVERRWESGIPGLEPEAGAKKKKKNRNKKKKSGEDDVKEM